MLVTDLFVMSGYFMDDHHPSKYGYALIASVLSYALGEMIPNIDEIEKLALESQFTTLKIKEKLQFMHLEKS